MKENIKGMLHYTRQAFGVSLVLMLVCGLLFPLLLSGLSAVLFPHQAEGSLIEINGKAVAAENVGQEFTEDYYSVSYTHLDVYKRQDKILPIVKEWQDRPLEEIYAVVFMDAIHYHVRNEGRIVKRAVYCLLYTSRCV